MRKTAIEHEIARFFDVAPRKVAARQVMESLGAAESFVGLVGTQVERVGFVGDVVDGVVYTVTNVVISHIEVS